MEGRVSWRGDLATTIAAVEEWRGAGASHLSINTMGAGFATAQEHLHALTQLLLHSTSSNDALLAAGVAQKRLAGGLAYCRTLRSRRGGQLRGTSQRLITVDLDDRPD